MLGIERSSHYQENQRIHIDVSVQKECRGRGLGTSLLNHAKVWSISKGISSIELEIIANNPVIILYKRLGYNEVG